jgi:hypothetical protein
MSAPFNPDALARECPDCEKARAKYDRLDARMAKRGNFGIVPLPRKCKKHLAALRAQVEARAAMPKEASQ